MWVRVNTFASPMAKKSGLIPFLTLVCMKEGLGKLQLGEWNIAERPHVLVGPPAESMIHIVLFIPKF